MVARRADLSPDASGGKPQPRHQRAHSARFVIEPLPDPALSFRYGSARTATALTALGACPSIPIVETIGELRATVWQVIAKVSLIPFLLFQFWSLLVITRTGS